MCVHAALVTNRNYRAVCLRKLTQLAAGTAGEGLDEVFSDYVGAVLNGALISCHTSCMMRETTVLRFILLA